MKLWYLERLAEDTEYGEALAFVVRAETEDAAREFAAAQAGDECASTWRDPALTSVIELTSEGAAGVVLRDFKAG